MLKIYGYIISCLLLITSLPLPGQINKKEVQPDSVVIPLKIRAGIELTGPVMYFTDKDKLSFEGHFSGDLNEKTGFYAAAGFSDFRYSQYNYDYLNKGIYFKAGLDINLLKPEMAMGKYWAGLGFRYGISRFSQEIPVLKHENYWGIASSSVAPLKSWGHFLEVAPGFRAEIIDNISIGWSVCVRKLIYTGTGRDLRPVYFPGYGQGGKSFSTGINYFLIWNFTFKKIKVEIKEDPPEEPEEEDGETEATFSGNR